MDPAPALSPESGGQLNHLYFIITLELCICIVHTFEYINQPPFALLTEHICCMYFFKKHAQSPLDQQNLVIMMGQSSLDHPIDS